MSTPVSNDDEDIDFKIFDSGIKYEIASINQSSDNAVILELVENFGTRDSSVSFIPNEGTKTSLINLNLQPFVTFKFISEV